MFIAIGGEPASGKTTLMRSILAELSTPTAFKFGKLRGQTHASERVYVLGIYDGHGTFEGTDRLSMAVQPDAIKFIQHARKTGFKILYEGDRLFNGKFLKAAREAYGEIKAFLIEAPEEEKHRRHGDRGDTQSEKFLKGRKTKYLNIAKEIPCQNRPHVTAEDTKKIRDEILTLIRD